MWTINDFIVIYRFNYCGFEALRSAVCESEERWFCSFFSHSQTLIYTWSCCSKGLFYSYEASALFTSSLTYVLVLGSGILSCLSTFVSFWHLPMLWELQTLPPVQSPCQEKLLWKGFCPEMRTPVFINEFYIL